MKTKNLLPYVLSYFLLMLHFPVYAEEVVVAEEPTPSCEGTYVYNEHAKTCVDTNDDKMLDNKAKQCSWEPEGESRDTCMGKIAAFGNDNTVGLSEATDDKQLGMKGIKAVAAIGTIIGGAMARAAATASAVAAVTKAGEAANAGLKAQAAGKGAFCYSSMMSVGAFVLSLINSSSMNKDAKKAISDSTKDLKKLVAENKKNQGKSYEMQIKLMEAYKKALDGGSAAAQIRIDGHKSEITSHTVVGVAGLIEWGISSICPGPTCNPVRGACAMWTSIAAGIGGGISTQMLGISEDAKKKYDEESAQLADVLKKYREFFDSQVIDSQTLPSLASGENIRANSPTNVKADGSGTEGAVAAEEITEFRSEVCAMEPSSPCCNSAGAECQLISINGAPSYILDGFEQNDGEEILSNLNSNLNADGSFGDDELSLAIDKNLRKAKLLKRKVGDGLVNSKVISKSDLDKFDNKKIFKAYLKKTYGDENYSFGKGVDQGLVDAGLKEDKKDSSKSEGAVKTAAVVAPTFVIPKMKKLDLSDLDDKNDDASLLASSADSNSSRLASGEEYVYKDEDIVKKPSVSIFNIISNRYNIMRLKKGFGTKKVTK